MISWKMPETITRQGGFADFPRMRAVSPKPLASAPDGSTIRPHQRRTRCCAEHPILLKHGKILTERKIRS